MLYLAVCLASLAGGAVQTVTGFGAGVVLVMILSRFFDMTAASSLNTAVCVALSASLAWQFRREISWTLLIPPAIPYIITSVLAIRLISSMDMTALAVIFALFLMVLAVFFLFFEKRVHLSGSYPTAIVCGGISGIFAGLFGVGGPLMALYFLTVTSRRATYVGTIQFFFLLTNLISLATRFTEGLYGASLFPATVIGIAGIIAGKWLGLRIAEKLDGEKLKKIIYIFVGISGAVTLIQQIL